MNFDYNDYDSRQELFENQNEFEHRFYDNNYRNYEEEYEFRNNNGKINNNVEQYFQERFLCKDYNKNINPVQNSLSNMSNNFLPSDQQNNDNLNSNSIISRSPIENYNKYKSNENNYNNYYKKKENNSITLLNLTDKIYEDDEHLQKGIISRKSLSKGNSGKVKPKKKKSSKLDGGGDNNNNSNKKNRKSLFIVNNKKENNNQFEVKRNNNLKYRASMFVKHSENDNFGAFYKIRQKQRKNSALIDIENEKNNYGINILEENTKKNKFKKFNSNQIQEECSSPNNQGLRLLKSKKSKTIKTSKNKLPLSEPEKEEEEAKMITKKNNMMKIEKVSNEKIQKEEINKIEIYADNKNNKPHKARIKHCLFCCCLKPNLDDSNIK
jgi:hypothetical protein